MKTVQKERQAISLAHFDPETLLPRSILAEYLGVHPATISRAYRRGDLPAPKKIFKGLFWRVGDVIAHLEKIPVQILEYPGNLKPGWKKKDEARYKPQDRLGTKRRSGR